MKEYYNQSIISRMSPFICDSLGNGKERGFRIDRDGNSLNSYTGDGVESNNQSQHVTITSGKNTVADGHVHWSCQQQNNFSPQDYKSMGKSGTYYLANIDGTFRKWQNGKNKILPPKLDFTECKCPKKYRDIKGPISCYDNKINRCK